MSIVITNVMYIFAQPFEVILLKIIIVMLTRLLLDLYLGAISKISVTAEILSFGFQLDCK